MVVELEVALDPSRAPTAAQGGRGFDPNEVDPVVGLSPLQARQEIDDALAEMQGFHNLQPDEVIRLAGGHTARLTQIAVWIRRMEGYQPTLHWKLIRTDEIEPVLAELERQFRNASRLESVRELDWKIESGQR